MTLNNEHLVDAFRNGFRVSEDGSLCHLTKTRLPSVRYRMSEPQVYLRFSWHNPRTQKVRDIMVHRLAAYQWFGEAIFGDGVQVRHLNGCSDDNRKENISYGTQSQNMMDRPPEKRLRIAKKAASKIRRFSDAEVVEIRADRASGMKYRDLMKKYCMTSKGTLSFIINQKTYKTDNIDL